MAHPAVVIIAIVATTNTMNVDGIAPKHHLAAVFNDWSTLDPNPKGHGGAIMDAQLSTGGGYRRAVTVGNMNRPRYGEMCRDGAVGGIDNVDGLILAVAAKGNGNGEEMERRWGQGKVG